MTRDQYKAAIKKLDLTPVQAGRLFGYGRRQANRWTSETDTTPIPHLVGVNVKLLLSGKIKKEDLI